jgi:hypothetical protein
MWCVDLCAVSHRLQRRRLLFYGERSGVQEIEPLKAIEPSPPVRLLKIEAVGDSWKGLIKPKICLMGRWLERAGFRPGHRVHITCVAPGVIELRSSDALMVNEAKPASAEQSK